MTTDPGLCAPGHRRPRASRDCPWFPSSPPWWTGTQRARDGCSSVAPRAEDEALQPSIAPSHVRWLATAGVIVRNAPACTALETRPRRPGRRVLAGRGLAGGGDHRRRRGRGAGPARARRTVGGCCWWWTTPRLAPAWPHCCSRSPPIPDGGCGCCCWRAAPGSGGSAWAGSPQRRTSPRGPCRAGPGRGLRGGASPHQRRHLPEAITKSS